MITDHRDFCETLVDSNPVLRDHGWQLQIHSSLDPNYPIVLNQQVDYPPTEHLPTALIEIYNTLEMSVDQARWLHERLTEILRSVDRKYIEIRSGNLPSSLTDPDVGECLARFDLPLAGLSASAELTITEPTAWYWRIYDGNRNVLRQGYSTELYFKNVLCPGDTFYLYPDDI